jgi:hypothetical protein
MLEDEIALPEAPAEICASRFRHTFPAIEKAKQDEDFKNH